MLNSNAAGSKLSVACKPGGNSITYGYDAAGSKLSVAYKSGANVAKTEYAGNKVYRNGTLSMILTEEGYITLSGTTPAYHYYLKDHQGNNRVVISQSGAVEQVNHYYPFGGLFGEGTQTSNQPYRYNGKELDRQFGMDTYDYGARHYDAAIARWGTPDPLAEEYFGLSPYVYCNNNPVRDVDPTGMVYGEYELNDKGEWTKISNVGDNIGVDFYHTGLKTDKGRELTLVQDKEGNSAKMFGARDLLKGGEIRDNDVSWSTITSEYLSGTGPDNSIFEGDHPSNLAIQEQLKYAVAKVNFQESGKLSQFTPINWNLLDVAVTPDMQAQMMGSYGASFYKLGDRTLSFIVDEKSKSSFFYHLPVENTPRDHSRVYNPWAGTWTRQSNSLNTTQQIYLFWAK